MLVEQSVRSQLRPGKELSAAITAIRRAGGRVWAVGGTVRDAVLGLPRAEWDLATDVPAERVAASLGAEHHVRVEPALGAVATRLDGSATVWTTLREESDYRPDRRPARVRFVDDVNVDAVRRDYTVNALYCELPDGDLEDPCGGMEDLLAARLRVIGDPIGRLREDPLRVLRGVRFAASFRFVIEAATRRGLREAAPRCSTLTPPRIFGELGRALCGPGRGRVATLLAQLGLIPAVLPELGSRTAARWVTTARFLDALPDATPAAAWAAISGDGELADAALTRLGASREVRRATVDLLSLADAFRRWPALPRSARREVLRRCWVDGADGYLEAVQQVENLPPSRIETLNFERDRLRSELRAPLVRGSDVLAAGLTPGRGVGEVLAVVRAAVERGLVHDRPGALAIVREQVADRVKANGADRR